MLIIELQCRFGGSRTWPEKSAASIVVESMEFLDKTGREGSAVAGGNTRGRKLAIGSITAAKQPC